MPWELQPTASPTVQYRNGLTVDGGGACSNRNPVSGFFHQNRGPPNFAIRLFVTTKKFRIDYTQTKIFYDQLETFGANFTPQILFSILQKN